MVEGRASSKSHTLADPGCTGTVTRQRAICLPAPWGRACVEVGLPVPCLPQGHRKWAAQKGPCLLLKNAVLDVR